MSRPSHAPTPTTSREVDQRGEQRERAVDQGLPHHDVQVVEMEAQDRDPDREREAAGTRRPRSRRSAIVSWLRSMVAVIPTSATPNPNTTHLICCRSTPVERRNRRMSDTTEAAKIAGKKTAISESSEGSCPTAGDVERVRDRDDSTEPVSDLLTQREVDAEHRYEGHAEPQERAPPWREGRAHRGTAAASGRPRGRSRTTNRSC